MFEMHDFAIQPLVGIGPITFGMKRNEVRNILQSLGGEPSRQRSTKCDTFFQSAFQVSYDAEDGVEFIETARSDRFRITLAGRSLHGLLVEDTVEWIAEIAPGEWEPSRRAIPKSIYRFTYVVPTLQLAFWRGIMREPNQEPDDTSGRIFESIAVGPAGYFDKRLSDRSVIGKPMSQADKEEARRLLGL